MSEPAKPAETAQATSADWPKLIDEWLADDFKANPESAVYQGKHEYDGVLSDVSEAGIAAEIGASSAAALSCTSWAVVMAMGARPARS